MPSIHPATVPPGSRLLAALEPSPEVRPIVAAVIARLAAELGDVDLLDLIADHAEHPTGVPTRDLIARAGITNRQLDYWTQHGWLTAKDRVRTGPGSPTRVYHPREVVKARIMGSLVTVSGMTPATAASVAESILETGAAEIAGFRITRQPTSPHITTDTGGDRAAPLPTGHGVEEAGIPVHASSTPAPTGSEAGS